VNREATSSRSANSVGSLAGACAILTGLLFVAGLGFAWYGNRHFGSVGIQAAAVAGAICWLAGCLALVISFAGRRLGFPLQAVLAGTGVRLGLPMLAGLLLHNEAKSLADAGVFVMILGNYLIMLLAETLLSLKFVSPSSKPMTKAA
jgi:hypothetical protein